MAVSTKETDCVGDDDGVAALVVVSVEVKLGVCVRDCEVAWEPL